MQWKRTGLTDTTDRIIFPAKAADQSEIDADSVRMKVHSTVHLQDCASDFRRNRVRSIQNVWALGPLYRMDQKAEPQTHIRNSVKF